MSKKELLLPKPILNQMAADWLKEDIPSFDWGAFVVGNKKHTATLFAKSPGVLAGVPFFDAVFSVLNASSCSPESVDCNFCKVEWHFQEGQFIDTKSGRVAVATVTGPVDKLLQGERCALNVLARASGIATLAHRLSSIKAQKGWNGVIAGTRKTTPGFRMVEKYAMVVGGVDCHRMDLSSMIMLKDNHIWSHDGSITQAVKIARGCGGFSLKIDVECRSYEEAIESAKAGADIVMLDNFNPTQAIETAQKLKQQFPHLLIEVSGGIVESNIGNYMHNSIDILSSGSLSQGVPHVDFSLKINH